MGTSDQIPRNTQQKLKAELDARSWGARTLARVMAQKKGQPQRVESLRRQIRRYLDPVATVVPTTASRYDIEEALEIERDALKADEEEDSEAARMSRLTIDEILQIRAEQYVERAFSKRAAREEMTA